MLNLEKYQADLISYILGSPDDELANQVASLSGKATEIQSRLTVYRNNYLYSMSESLADSYPVINRLLGNELFKALAHEYVSIAPPSSASLLDYGYDFLDFITHHRTTSNLPYLKDVGQIEWLYIKCFHGPETKTLTLYDLLDVAEDLLPKVSFTAQPNLHLFHSRHSALDIWQANLEEDVPELQLDSLSETYLMLYRDGFDVIPMQLNAIAFQFILALKNGLTIEQAWQETKPLTPKSADDEVNDLLSFFLQLPTFQELHINH